MIQYSSSLCKLGFIEKTIKSHKVYIRWYNKGKSMYSIILDQNKEFFYIEK